MFAYVYVPVSIRGPRGRWLLQLRFRLYLITVNKRRREILTKFSKRISPSLSRPIESSRTSRDSEFSQDPREVHGIERYSNRLDRFVIEYHSRPSVYSRATV